jgi:hypothetical protein
MSPKFSGYYNGSFTHFWYSRVELDQRKHGGKLQRKVERSYDRKSLRAGTRLGLEKLLFDTPS